MKNFKSVFLTAILATSALAGLSQTASATTLINTSSETDPTESVDLLSSVDQATLLSYTMEEWYRMQERRDAQHQRFLDAIRS